MDCDTRLGGERLLVTLDTPEIYRSYVMGVILEHEAGELKDGKHLFSINDLKSDACFNRDYIFEFLFPHAKNYLNQSTSQPEKDGEVKSIGNDYERTRDNGPNRHLG